MVLVDTSVWVEHLRRGDAALAILLTGEEVLCHSLVIGELACGHLRNRAEILDLLESLPAAPHAGGDEIVRFIARHRLQGRGLGLIDMHLLASCTLSRSVLWTYDAKLAKAAVELGVRHE